MTEVPGTHRWAGPTSGDPLMGNSPVGVSLACSMPTRNSIRGLLSEDGPMGTSTAFQSFRRYQNRSPTTSPSFRPNAGIPIACWRDGVPGSTRTIRAAGCVTRCRPGLMVRPDPPLHGTCVTIRGRVPALNTSAMCAVSTRRHGQEGPA